MNFNSLHIKVSLSVAAAALFVVLVSSQFFYDRSYQSSFTDSERSVQQLLETLESTAAISAYVGNRELAQQVVSGLVQNDIVVRAKIVANREVLSQAGEHQKSGAEKFISIALHAPFDETEVVGELSVEPNVPLIESRARDSAMVTTLGLAAQAGLVTLLVLVLVYWLMTRPLSNLSGRLHGITPGDGERLNITGLHRGDEIGLLTGDINTLLHTVDLMLKEERQLRHRVEQLEMRFRGIFEDSSAGIFLMSDKTRLITANPTFFRLTGISEQEQLQLSDVNLVDKIFLDAQDARTLIQQANSSLRPCSADLRIRKDNNETIHWVHCIFSPAADKYAIEGVMYDVTQRKHSEEQTRELAEKDSLTGLSNRMAIENVLHHLIHQVPAEKQEFALLLIDLDRFKFINDTYGHDAGDLVLQTIAERLRAQVRDSDIVARLGGDEFLILLKHAGKIETVTRIAEKILAAQKQPIILIADSPDTSPTEIIGMSIGIALYPMHGDDVQSLRKHADQAMYEVKRQGKNSYAFYAPIADKKAAESTKVTRQG